MLSVYSDKRFQCFNSWKQCIHESQEERDKNKGKFFSMSSAGKCGRQLAYAYLGYEQPAISARTRRVFEHGSMFEDQVRYIIKNNPYGIRIDCPEMEVESVDPPARGHIDGIVWCDTIEHLVAVINGEIPNMSRDESMWGQHHLELKTMAQIGFQNVVRKGMYETQPDYIAQSQCYLHQLKDRVNDTWFVIENKNTNNVIGQVVPYLPERYKEVEKKLKMVHQIVENGGLPDREHEKTDWHCEYCSYTDICWEEC